MLVAAAVNYCNTVTHPQECHHPEHQMVKFKYNNKNVFIIQIKFAVVATVEKNE